MDVSSHQGAVHWTTARANGAQFAYVKATRGTMSQSAMVAWIHDIANTVKVALDRLPAFAR